MLFLRRKKQKSAARPKKRGKKSVTRTRKKPKALKKITVSKGEWALIGNVSHYFPHVKAGAIIIKKGTIAIGDTIHIKGYTTDFKQKVKSLQIDRAAVGKGSKGDEVGIRVKSRVRINDKVYKLSL